MKYYLITIFIIITTTGSFAEEFSTSDGLMLGFDRTGIIQSMHIDNHALPLDKEKQGGFYVQDIIKGKSPLPVTGRFKDKTFEGDVSQLDIKLSSRIQPSGQYIRIFVEVEDSSGTDRAINISFKIPINASGWKWWTRINNEETIQNGRSFSVWTSKNITGSKGRSAVIPVSALSRSGYYGLSLAVLPEYPRTCNIEYSDGCFSIDFDLGISRKTEKFPSKASACFILYRHDPEWGFRSALKRYYDFAPQYFNPRVTRGGSWLCGKKPVMTDSPEIRNAFGEPFYPYFAYRLVFPGSWERDTSGDKKYNVETYPFLIPRANVRYRGKQIIKDNTDALKFLRAFGKDDFKAYDPWVPYYWGDIWNREKQEIRKSIENSLLFDVKGEGIVDHIRYNKKSGVGMFSCVVNMDPDLYHGTDREKQTAGRTYLEYIQREIKNIPGIDGFYCDYVHPLGAHKNFNTDHFRYTDYPLSFDPGTGHLAIHNRFSLIEFYDRLWDMSRRTGSFFYGKKIFSNSIKPFDGGRAFLGFRTDVIGFELDMRMNPDDLYTFFYFGRMVAYKKPVLSLANENAPENFQDYLWSQEQIAARIKQSAFLGIPDSITAVFNNPELLKKNKMSIKTYIPLAIKLQEAGWEPLTYANVNEPGCIIERFGSPTQNQVYFSLFNRTQDKKTVTLSVSHEMIRFDHRKNLTVKELTGDKTTKFNISTDSGNLFIHDSIAPGDLKIYSLN
ncbi:MAG: hypothetical protein GY795_37400 [Desulfobacterales bacterium]|nr:hypothetical protein [Desulfobacterales bacterium]